MNQPISVADRPTETDRRVPEYPQSEPAVRTTLSALFAVALVFFVAAAVSAALAATPGEIVGTSEESAGSPGGPQTRPLQAPEPIDPNAVGSGALLMRSAGGFVPLPALSIDVEIEVTGPMVRGIVTQEFSNPTDEVIEALYVFPVPDRAAVGRMEMRIGDRVIRAVARERQEARRTYETARKEGRKASLVDQQRPNLFKTSVANINPGEAVVVTLEYVEEVDLRDDLLSLAFPLTLTARYGTDAAGENPANDVSNGDPDGEMPACLPGAHASAPAPMVTVRASLRPGVPILAPSSPSHRVIVSESDGGWRIETFEREVPADRDFRLEWRLARGSEPRASLLTEEHDGERYGLLLVVPPAVEAGASHGLPTETLFIVDVSGSMAGPSMEQAREALLAALDRLGPRDSFNLMKFNDGTALFRDGFPMADEATLDEARRWARDLSAGGGTHILQALMHGLELMDANPSQRTRRIIFLTDGAVSNERAAFSAITGRLDRTRLHAIGIGHAPNAWLLRKLATFGRGLCEFVSTGDGTRNRIAEFLERIDRPVLTDLTLDGEGLTASEILPERLPDLSSGEPLAVSLRFPSTDSTESISLSGWNGEGFVTWQLPVETTRSGGSGIALRWARRKAASLMDSLHEGADPDRVRDDVVDIGLAFGMVTRYTSLVAVEEVPSATGDSHAMRVANGSPGANGQGANAATLPIGGTDRPARRLAALLFLLTGLSAIVAVRLWTR